MRNSCQHSDWFCSGRVAAANVSLRWVWQQLRTNGARYSEAALLLGQGRYDEADSVVQAMPEERDLNPREMSERGRMLTYINVLATAAADNRNAYKLKPAEVAQLDQMIGTNYDRPSNWASNLLCAVYGKCRAPYTGPVMSTKSMLTRDLSRPADPTTAGAYGLQPNPARDLVTFQYQHAAEGDDGMVVIRQMNGQFIASIPMNGQQGQLTWSTSGIAPGTYLVEYLQGEHIIKTEKLIVQR